MSQLSTQGRPLAMQNLPVSAAPDYRHYAYNNPAASAGTIPFPQANSSYSYANYVPQ